MYKANYYQALAHTHMKTNGSSTSPVCRHSFWQSKILIITLCLSANIMFSQTPLEQAVNFTATDCYGGTINLFEILDGGQYVLIDFFYPDCGGCQLLIEKVVQAYYHLGCNNHDVFFMEIAFIGNDERCKEWCAERLVEFPTISANEGTGLQICNQYGVISFPTVILIAPDRSIVIQQLYPVDTYEYITSKLASCGINSYDCETSTALPYPQNFSLEMITGNISLTWDEVENAQNFLGYNIYRNIIPIRRNIAENFFIEKYSGGAIEYCIAASYTEGISQKICILFDDIFCYAPENTQAVFNSASEVVKITWDITPYNSSSQLAFYNIYRDDELIISHHPEWMGANVIDADVELNKSYTYKVEALYSDNCISFGDETTVFTAVINKIESVDDIFATIYPNPAEKLIRISNTADIERISIYNSLGQQVFIETKIDLGEQIIDVSAFPAGIYFIKLNGKRTHSTHKLIKKPY